MLGWKCLKSSGKAFGVLDLSKKNIIQFYRIFVVSSANKRFFRPPILLTFLFQFLTDRMSASSINDFIKLALCLCFCLLAVSYFESFMFAKYKAAIMLISDKFILLLKDRETNGNDITCNYIQQAAPNEVSSFFKCKHCQKIFHTI